MGACASSPSVSADDVRSDAKVAPKSRGSAGSQVPYNGSNNPDGIAPSKPAGGGTKGQGAGIPGSAAEQEQQLILQQQQQQMQQSQQRNSSQSPYQEQHHQGRLLPQAAVAAPAHLGPAGPRQTLRGDVDDDDAGGGGRDGNDEDEYDDYSDGDDEEDEYDEDEEEEWETDLHELQPPELQEYRFSELMAATDAFAEYTVLGEGGFGKVYKGNVVDRFPPDGSQRPYRAQVAIKKLNPTGYQSNVEWMREILVLGKLQHRNLVRLIGYCAEVEDLLLVYEYVPLGSLDYHLWPAPGTDVAPLTWQARLRIAHDAAAGLAHLHANNFIHRDFKAPNILITLDFSGKLTDFGLAKDGPDPGQTHVSTQIMGTMGYLDPRYAESGQLSVKSDVYAYGVVLLELLTGKKAMGLSPGGKPKTLTSWARPLLAKVRPDLESLVDPNLPEPFPEKVARTLAIAAKHCIQDDTNMRPTMRDVLYTLRPLYRAAFS